MTTFKSLTAGLYLAVASIALSAGSAQAVLMDNGTITLDTDTNLEWLDLTESTNRSFNDVASHFGAGGNFEGWRHANDLELQELFSNGGFPPELNVPSANPLMQTLIELLGVTNQLADAFGTTSDASGLFAGGPLFPTSAGIALLRNGTGYRGGPPSHFSSIGPLIGSPLDAASEGRGNWLVRSAAIPEPAGLSLFGAGVLLLTVIRRRKHRS